MIPLVICVIVYLTAAGPRPSGPEVRVAGRSTGYLNSACTIESQLGLESTTVNGSDTETLFALVAGSTDTARIEGISAAGANPSLVAHTPSADLEIVQYGRPVQSPVTPVSPSGCPTPAVVTRAVREAERFEMIGVDAGLAEPTAAPTVEVGQTTGGDIREPEPVETADALFQRAKALGAALPATELLLGETIPGGTTTALAVLRALGERQSVSSSLPENPLTLKRSVVEEGLEASDLTTGETAGKPIETVRYVGDPVLCSVAGLTAGAVATETAVTLAGGTQMAAAAALARHAGVDAPLEIATTSFLASDETADIAGLAADLDISLTVTDPHFDRRDHPAMNAYVAGEAKEGVGMGGALSLADRSALTSGDLLDSFEAVYSRLLEDDAGVTA